MSMDAPRATLSKRIEEVLLGGPAAADLPGHVRRHIKHLQLRAEILIGWVQLGLVLTFGILYAISPKTFTDEVAFEPVPLALAGYLAITVGRLAWAHRGKLPRWFLSLSVIIDMALLLGLIWSFHLQYEQVPAFYLKVPTLLYVFIFIALRALRFEARYVLLAGGTAALGWLALVFFAVLADPGAGPITRDYVHYMTSSSVLLGAEFDKVISILVVTLILALAIVRAKRLLVRSVAEGTAADQLSRFSILRWRTRFAPPNSRFFPAMASTARRRSCFATSVALPRSRARRLRTR